MYIFITQSSDVLQLVLANKTDDCLFSVIKKMDLFSSLMTLEFQKSEINECRYLKNQHYFILLQSFAYTFICIVYIWIYFFQIFADIWICSVLIYFNCSFLYLYRVAQKLIDKSHDKDNEWQRKKTMERFERIAKNNRTG